MIESRLHDEILGDFLQYENPTIEHKLYKLPAIVGPNAYMFNRVVLLTKDKVYKIHLKIYQNFQKELVNNLNNFFQYYRYPIEFLAHYKPNICWTKWERIPGKNLGVQHFDNNTWIKYLDYANECWNLHMEASREMKVEEGYMWWHDDITAWNVIDGNDEKYHLIDWDDFRLCKVTKAKQKFIALNLEYATMTKQDTKIIIEKLGNL